ncbi:uncharacterized protein sS8_2975 [Methylocaldum marinum]|uniref:Uncharacterized protein n=1 Tax=Methylocaldum marinum TaxID=1432792 RepID=A0A250KTD4_9GAMM|nr:nitroreductase family protein [Methylocaldum marinum]BBA34918.1 uncharacterized protein sS8_2975 [Methylocaldum marinum]
MTRPDPILQSRRRFLRQTGALAAGAVISPDLFRAAHAAQSTSPYLAWEQTTKGDLTDLEYVALCGTLAANAHNTQPWAFNLLGNRIVLYADLARHLGRADPRRRLMLMGLGCAAENMVVAAAQLGYAATVADTEAGGFLENGGRCAALELTRRSDSNSHPWFPALFRRQTTRAEFGPLSIPRNEFTASLDVHGEIPGVHLAWYGTASEHEAIVRITADAAAEFVANDAAYRDSMAWFRRSRREWETYRDGISIFTSDAPWLVKEWVELLSTPEDLVSAEFRQGEIDVVKRLAEATPLWSLVWSERDTPHAWFQGGRLMERVYLAAAAQGLALHPLAYPTESPVGSAGLAKSLGLAPGAVPLMLLRVGLARPLERSVRRPLEAVLR